MSFVLKRIISAVLLCFSLSSVALSTVSSTLPLGTTVAYAQDDRLETWAEFALNQLPNVKIRKEDRSKYYSLQKSHNQCIAKAFLNGVASRSLSIQATIQGAYNSLSYK